MTGCLHISSSCSAVNSTRSHIDRSKPARMRLIRAVSSRAIALSSTTVLFLPSEVGSFTSFPSFSAASVTLYPSTFGTTFTPSITYSRNSSDGSSASVS